MRIGTATCFRNKDFEGSTPLPSTIIEFQSYGFESRRGHIKIKLAYGRLPEIGLSGSPAKGCGVTATCKFESPTFRQNIHVSPRAYISSKE